MEMVRLVHRKDISHLLLSAFKFWVLNSSRHRSEPPSDPPVDSIHTQTAHGITDSNPRTIR